MPREVSPAGAVGPPLPEPPPMAEHRDYPHPPIAEALVQFTFGEPIAWNVATPGRVYERLKNEYPADPETQAMVQATLDVAASGGTTPDFTLSQGSQRVIYKDESHTRLLVLNDRSFSVNSLRPYEGWEKLSQRMAEAITSLQDVIEIANIGEVSVRYINQIPLPRGHATEDYFAYEIRTVRSGSSYLINFVQRVESLLPDGVTRAGTTFASTLPQTEDVFPLILDIEFKRSLGQMASIRDAVAVAEELKALENSEFESLITNKARELFQ